MVSKYHGFTTLGLNEMKSIHFISFHLKRLVVKPINLAWADIETA
tara:strand:- start:8400 stop:8534 length:135 start_codon:yes stop_codon:yes gene_type:complete